MEIFFVYISLCFIAGYIASQKGRSGVGFFFLSVFLSPLVGILAAFGAAKGTDHDTQVRIDESGAAERVASERTCPHCAETIKLAALVCKHCGRDVPVAQTAA